MKKLLVFLSLIGLPLGCFAAQNVTRFLRAIVSRMPTAVTHTGTSEASAGARASRLSFQSYLSQASQKPTTTPPSGAHQAARPFHFSFPTFSAPTSSVIPVPAAVGAVGKLTLSHETLAAILSCPPNVPNATAAEPIAFIPYQPPFSPEQDEDDEDADVENVESAFSEPTTTLDNPASLPLPSSVPTAVELVPGESAQNAPQGHLHAEPEKPFYYSEPCTPETVATSQEQNGHHQEEEKKEEQRNFKTDSAEEEFDRLAVLFDTVEQTTKKEETTKDVSVTKQIMAGSAALGTGVVLTVATKRKFFNGAQVRTLMTQAAPIREAVRHTTQTSTTQTPVGTQSLKSYLANIFSPQNSRPSHAPNDIMQQFKARTKAIETQARTREQAIREQFQARQTQLEIQATERRKAAERAAQQRAQQTQTRALLERNRTEQKSLPQETQTHKEHLVLQQEAECAGHEQPNQTQNLAQEKTVVEQVHQPKKSVVRSNHTPSHPKQKRSPATRMATKKKQLFRHAVRTPVAVHAISHVAPSVYYVTTHPAPSPARPPLTTKPAAKPTVPNPSTSSAPSLLPKEAPALKPEGKKPEDQKKEKKDKEDDDTSTSPDEERKAQVAVQEAEDEKDDQTDPFRKKIAYTPKEDGDQNDSFDKSAIQQSCMPSTLSSGHSTPTRNAPLGTQLKPMLIAFASAPLSTEALKQQTDATYDTSPLENKGQKTVSMRIGGRNEPRKSTVLPISAQEQKLSLSRATPDLKKKASPFPSALTTRKPVEKEHKQSLLEWGTQFLKDNIIRPLKNLDFHTTELLEKRPA